MRHVVEAVVSAHFPGCGEVLVAFEGRFVFRSANENL